MYPHEFKKYFFDVLSNLKKNKDGDLVWPKSVWKPFFLPSGNPNSVPNKKSDFDVFNKKMEKASIREWPFKREDTKQSWANIMMTDDDIENCTFEPNVGKQDPRYYTIWKLGYHPREEDGKTFVDKFGKNF